MTSCYIVSGWQVTKKMEGYFTLASLYDAFIHPYWFEVLGSIIHMLGAEDVEGMAIHIKCSLIDSGASGISRVGDMVCPYLLFSNGGMPSPVGKFR